MARISASSHGESRLRMLRIVRRGDRHDPRDLTVSFRFEGEFSSAFLDGNAAGILPGETVKNLVHAAAREHGGKEIETFGLALCAQALARQPRISRVRVDVTERPWHRLEAGGKAQAQTFLSGSSERRMAVVTSNGREVSVVGGLEDLSIMRSAGFAPDQRRTDDGGGADGLQRLLIADVFARWTYTSGDVTFGPFRQGVRAAILETLAWHPSRTVQHALYTAADVILTTYEEIAEVTLALHERPYRPADPFSSGTSMPDDLFIAIDDPVGVVEVTVDRK